MAGGLEHLRGIKVTDQAIEKIAWLKAHTDVVVFCGDDAVLYRSLLLGADGCMVIAPALCPSAFQEVWQLFGDGRVRESYSLFSRRVLPFIHMFGIGSEIAATKALYTYLGVFTSDAVRPPLERCDNAWREQLIMAYETCNTL